ncbi:MAG: MotA/TolQ/ExbB proton channel family protein [Verrucomicrobia bacterium]|nr:MotA/TolQ/ExbB proton channel family protein [Verrucomicrobiota bacterium]
MNSPNRSICLIAIFGIFFWAIAEMTPVAAQGGGGGEAPAAPAAPAAAPAAGGEAAGGEAGGEHKKQEAKTLWGIIKEGGWIMFPLSLISMWCTALIIEGFVRIRLPNFAPPDLILQLKTAFAEENYQQAWRLCKSRSTFLTNTLRYGLERIGRGRVACESAISEHSLKESMIFKTKISYLSTIGVISPMVGLLGTVTGMIKAFQTLGAGGIGDPSLLAAAIGEVLIATATGLLVAIPAFFLYYFFRNRLQSVIVLSEDVMNQLMTDVKYDELQGIKIGESLEAELGGGAAAPAAAAPAAAAPAPAAEPGKRVSQAVAGVTVACPTCNAAITAGTPKCASCGTELQWG